MSSGFDRATSQLIWPVLEKALAGKTWDGKETVLYAFAKFVENTKHIWSAEDAIAKTFVKVSEIICHQPREPHVVPLSQRTESRMETRCPKQDLLTQLAIDYFKRSETTKRDVPTSRHQVSRLGGLEPRRP